MKNDYQALGMGEFSDDEIRSMQEIERGIDLEQGEMIGQYGQQPVSGNERANTFASLMLNSPVNALASTMAGIVLQLDDADPRLITQKQSWLKKLTGASLETRVRYQFSRQRLEELLNEAEQQAVQVEAVIGGLNRLLEDHRAESQKLRLLVAAGKHYLEKNPSAGKAAQRGVVVDNPRERFARRLTNIAALLTSHQMEQTQLELARAQAIDLLDRYYEVSKVLVPLWRSHTMTVMNNEHNSPEAIAAANQAHAALRANLTAMTAKQSHL